MGARVVTIATGGGGDRLGRAGYVALDVLGEDEAGHDLVRLGRRS